MKTLLSIRQLTRGVCLLLTFQLSGGGNTAQQAQADPVQHMQGIFFIGIPGEREVVSALELTDHAFHSPHFDPHLAAAIHAQLHAAMSLFQDRRSLRELRQAEEDLNDHVKRLDRGELEHVARNLRNALNFEQRAAQGNFRPQRAGRRRVQVYSVPVPQIGVPPVVVPRGPARGPVFVDPYSGALPQFGREPDRSSRSSVVPGPSFRQPAPRAGREPAMVPEQAYESEAQEPGVIEEVLPDPQPERYVFPPQENQGSRRNSPTPASQEPLQLPDDNLPDDALPEFGDPSSQGIPQSGIPGAQAPWLFGAPNEELGDQANLGSEVGAADEAPAPPVEHLEEPQPPVLESPQVAQGQQPRTQFAPANTDQQRKFRPLRDRLAGRENGEFKRVAALVARAFADRLEESAETGEPLFNGQIMEGLGEMGLGEGFGGGRLFERLQPEMAQTVPSDSDAAEVQEERLPDERTATRRAVPQLPIPAAPVDPLVELGEPDPPLALEPAPVDEVPAANRRTGSKAGAVRGNGPKLTLEPLPSHAAAD